MSVRITAEQFNLLPLHDAEVISWLFDYGADQKLTLRLRVEINHEESMDEFTSLGVDTRRIEIFLTVREANCQFHGMFEPPVFLLDYEATTGSPCQVTLGCNSGDRLAASVSSIGVGPIT